MSRILVGGIGRKRISELRVTVVGGGLTRHRVEVFVNPADYDTAVALFQPSLLDRALEASGDALLAGSAFSSAFQGIALLGLLGSRGVGGAASELLDRAFPDLPSQVLLLSRHLQDQAARNERLVRLLTQRPGSGSGVVSSTAGARAGADADEPGTDSGSGDNEGSGSDSQSLGSWLGTLFRSLTAWLGSGGDSPDSSSPFED